jgi:hypothetical protein
MLRKINPELWLLLFLVVIAAMLNFLVASQGIALVFYFLPTLFSAYYFGRRHATLTAFASVILVVMLTYLNPTMFSRRLELPFARWFDITVWGGVLVLAGYSTGTLYQRNQKTLRDMEEGYDGMLVILQNFLDNQKYSDAHAYRIAMCATRIAEAVGLDSRSVEDIRMAALLFNMKELGITHEVLCKAARFSEEDLSRRKSVRLPAANAMGSALTRAIPIFMSERALRQSGGKPDEASFEVQILALAEEYESLMGGQNGAASRMSPSQAGQELVRRSTGRYDSMILDAFSKAFGGQAAGAGA